MQHCASRTTVRLLTRVAGLARAVWALGLAARFTLSVAVAVAVLAALARSPGNHVVPVQTLIMSNQHWPEMAGALAQMAMGIRCVTQLRVPQGNDLPTPGGTRRGKGDKGDEAGYNPWRGSEYVHDPSTGDNFIVTSSHWSDTGPDGPGYYKRNGNDWTKLSPGRSR